MAAGFSSMTENGHSKLQLELPTTQEQYAKFKAVIEMLSVCLNSTSDTENPSTLAGCIGSESTY